MLTTLAPTVAAHWAHPWGAGFGFLFLLIPLFWIAVIALVVGLARRRHAHWGAWSHPGFAGAVGSRAAESTLAERFAQGDIDEKEYRARLEVLRANAFPQAPGK
ncbi:MAG TPA: hypothetical protein VGC18_11315 [Lacisediminihabitans sp.]|uniref:SHOCT domain-containing protein n=1 Tax=Lacisediminihabitans sp. TaxID=2787631 RepID=UPI002ED7B056